MKHLKKYNEDIDSNFTDNDGEHEITLDGIGAQHYESQTTVGYIIDGESYTFNIIEKGINDGTSHSIEFFCESGELPFELTQGIKDELYQIYADNCGF